MKQFMRPKDRNFFIVFLITLIIWYAALYQHDKVMQIKQERVDAKIEHLLEMENYKVLK
jgi:hypothetical protein